MILFWQPTYTDLTVSSNGLMEFLMGRMVTTMVFGRMVTTTSRVVLIAPLFTLLAPSLPHFRILIPYSLGVSTYSPNSEFRPPSR